MVVGEGEDICAVVSFVGGDMILSSPDDRGCSDSSFGICSSAFGSGNDSVVDWGASSGTSARDAGGSGDITRLNFFTVGFCAIWAEVFGPEMGLLALIDKEAVGRATPVVDIDGVTVLTCCKFVSRELAAGADFESNLFRLRFPAADTASASVVESVEGGVVSGEEELGIELPCLLVVGLERSTALITLFLLDVVVSV